MNFFNNIQKNILRALTTLNPGKRCWNVLTSHRGQFKKCQRIGVLLQLYKELLEKNVLLLSYNSRYWTLFLNLSLNTKSVLDRFQQRFGFLIFDYLYQKKWSIGRSWAFINEFILITNMQQLLCKRNLGETLVCSTFFSSSLIMFDNKKIGRF